MTDDRPATVSDVPADSAARTDIPSADSNGNANGNNGADAGDTTEPSTPPPPAAQPDSPGHARLVGRGVLDELTIFIITHNERRYLPRCLDSCRFAGHVVVLDSGSDDGTPEYAKRRGAEVAQNTHWDGFGVQKNRALALCRTKWVLNIDADEWISPDLADEITTVIRSESPALAYDVSRRCRFDGRIIRCCNWWPHRVTRLFQREHARFNDRLVHESVELDASKQGSRDAPLGHLQEELDHEPYRDLLHLIQKNMMYSRAGAEQMVRDGRRVTWLSMLAMGPLRFCRDMFVKGGWRAGCTGIVIASVQAFGVFARYAMVWLDARRIERGEDSRLQPDHQPPAKALGKPTGEQEQSTAVNRGEPGA